MYDMGYLQKGFGISFGRRKNPPVNMKTPCRRKAR
jgi:hypothetical protein